MDDYGTAFLLTENWEEKEDNSWGSRAMTQGKTTHGSIFQEVGPTISLHSTSHITILQQEQ